MWGFAAAGAVALLVALWALGRYTKGDPRMIADLLRTHGQRILGGGLVALSVFFAIRGNWLATTFLAPIGLGLLKVGPWAGGPWAQNASKSAGGRSTVRSAYLEMILEHDSGAMAGTVTRGVYQGRSLDALAEADLRTLAGEIAADPDSLALLEAYLDRRFPGRREHVEDDARARQGGARSSQAMTDEEAYQVLGLQPGANAEAVRAAHKALMKRLHPDQGGSTWLAAKINEAKDLLLRRHG